MFLIISHRFSQAIAVNPQLMYSLMRKKDDTRDGVMIVASERRDALQGILSETGFTELLCEIPGSHAPLLS